MTRIFFPGGRDSWQYCMCADRTGDAVFPVQSGLCAHRKVQFEDDEYYYYVKAVPKMAVAVPEKRVKRITTQRANQNVRHSHGKGKTRK